jgi:hypothetical protein
MGCFMSFGDFGKLLLWLPPLFLSRKGQSRLRCPLDPSPAVASRRPILLPRNQEKTEMQTLSQIAVKKQLGDRADRKELPWRLL